jgi:hypothetical protein
VCHAPILQAEGEENFKIYLWYRSIWYYQLASLVFPLHKEVTETHLRGTAKIFNLQVPKLLLRDSTTTKCYDDDMHYDMHYDNMCSIRGLGELIVSSDAIDIRRGVHLYNMHHLKHSPRV